MGKPSVWIWVIILILVIFGCREPVTSTVQATSTRTLEPTISSSQPTKEIVVSTVTSSTVEQTTTTAIPTTSSINSQAYPWPASIIAEEELSRNPVTNEERSTFDQLARVEFVANDPIALAIAYKGVPGPIDPIVEKEPASLNIGALQTFWIKNHDTNQWNQIQARLERITDHAYLWFDTSRELVDKNVYNAAAQAFEQMYTADRAVYGSEWSPGIDGDPHVYVVHASALALCNVSETTAHQCPILGYYSTTDELPAIVEPHSNQHELFVMNMDAGGIGGERYLLTLVHEFRHMIEYNYDRNDDDWEVEGTAMMAEDLLGYPRVPGDYGNSFTQQGTDLQLNAWSQGNTIPHYGKGYVFSRYIYQRLGADFFSRWVQHPENGMMALDVILEEMGYDFDAHELWLDWCVALSLLGFENITEEYFFGENFFVEPAKATVINSFPKEVTEKVNQYAFDVYDVRGNQPIEASFTGTTQVAVIENLLPASGGSYWWSGRANQSDMTLTKPVDLTNVEHATLNYSVYYSIERGYDYAYVAVSADEGRTWQGLVTPNMQGDKPEDDPGEAALTGHFYTGRNAGWLDESIDLSPYAGQEILLRFQYITDSIYTAPGFALDNIAIPEIGFFDDAESMNVEWESVGFSRVNAYEPQRFHLILVTFDEQGKPIVQGIPIKPDNSATIEIPLHQSNGKALMIVAATNPLIMTPAKYQLSFGQ